MSKRGEISSCTGNESVVSQLLRSYNLRIYDCIFNVWYYLNAVLSACVSVVLFRPGEILL